jgi:hypothetical protein
MENPEKLKESGRSGRIRRKLNLKKFEGYGII